MSWDITLTVYRNCESESGKRDRGRRPEQAGKTFGFKDIAESGKQRHDQATYGETEYELHH
jgi:hypothetical protein